VESLVLKFFLNNDVALVRLVVLHDHHDVVAILHCDCIISDDNLIFLRYRNYIFLLLGGCRVGNRCFDLPSSRQHNFIIGGH